ncbi:MAG: hypothetical protein K2N94_08565 [Lachnospiraceae bacterium]|nr:hypothetical protein [Lachnospiraceae bacterium]
MKKKCLMFLLCAALLLSGCSLFSAGSDTGTLTIGSSLTIDNTDSGRVLLSNSNALATNGLYYVSWGLGGKSPYEDGEGNTSELHDARLHLLLGEYPSSEAALSSMNTWLDSGRAEYEVLREEETVCNSQTYTMLIYRFRAEGGPYTNGVSLFGVCGSSAVCIELTCRDSFADDPEAALTDFLNCCTWLAD